MSLLEADPYDVRRARRAPGALGPFNAAGVLTAADVHVALRLAALSGEDDEDVLLAAALAVRGPRRGHVCVDLELIRASATVEAEEEADLSTLPWPDAQPWLAAVARSPLVSVGEGAADDPRPLRLSGTLLYLDRYWREEREVAADLAVLAGADDQTPAGAPLTADPAVLRGGIARLFAEDPGGRQALAAASAVLRRFAVVAGGPGTGKTTTVARIVALLAEQAEAAGAPPPLVALAAPTGKAAARLREAVHEEAAQLDVDERVRGQLQALTASTLHRLLGWRPGSHSRFRHHRGNRLPHDVVIVDETSMVGLTHMARLIEAVRPEARLVLVGDPGQLTSIEAGAVLGDIVGPAADGLRLSAAARATLEGVTGRPVEAEEPPAGATVADGVIVLDEGWRYDDEIDALAEAIRTGDADRAVELLAAADPDRVTWIARDIADPDAQPDLAPVREAAVAVAREVIDAARAGDAQPALDALGTFRVLCAHRRGPHGVETWMARVEAWLAEAIPGFAASGAWYPGRPLLVTRNDNALGLFNGDTGVVVASRTGQVSAAFDRPAGPVAIRPSRLDAVETVYAMTVHKAQGSQFATAAVLLPDPTSPILTRQLLYTAVTRVRKRLILAGTEEAVRAAIARPVARASGLEWRLWGGG